MVRTLKMAKRITKKRIPNVYLWCTRLKEGKIFGGKVNSGLNCVIKVEGTKKCIWQGKPARCIETAFMYDIHDGWNIPRWRKGNK